MKKIWKVLGLAALAASVPFSIRTNPETRERTYDALLWQLRTRPDPTTGKTGVTAVSILPNRLARLYGEESDPGADAELYCYPPMSREQMAEFEIDESDVESIF